MRATHNFPRLVMTAAIVFMAAAIHNVSAQSSTPPTDRDGHRSCAGILYAPSHDDNPEWRAEVFDILGKRVDYWDTRVSTPTIQDLQDYCCVFTWTNYAYDDKHAFGSVLADYVDGGGMLILGQWSYFGFGGDTAVPAEIVMPAYCPVTVMSYGVGTYAGDGTDCVHTGGLVSAYESNYIDHLTLNPGAMSDGTIVESDLPAVAWRPDRHVYYSAGNTGGTFTTGDTAQLVANMYVCGGDPPYGSCCDPATGDCEDDVLLPFCLPP